ncbi:hypothetical protein [Paenibacillus beijingensis]|uniref:Uncharacterized protein n=1 Tax=Paenibacillus beijingensis TaxID=1126833 RepID=A0A0D5NIP7_9BACL|nr:hypothetical protein [Paenibacillus beijingensis]AJY75126.1 hypothetical protein VN24_11735 [Paenibacillus beijingensis]
MSLQNTESAQQTLYKADPNITHTLKSVRENMHQICHHYKNRHVRVETMDGDVFEGTVLHCERGVLYLKLPGGVPGRGFIAGQQYYNDVILPLVLFELLVIALLS